MRLSLALPVLLLLAGCAAATPMTYLHLAPVPGPTVQIAAGPPITVAHVEMPPSIDRLALTTETSASTLALAPNASWAAPLGGMATRALAQNLQSRLAGATVLMPGEVAPQGGARVVRVDVIRFLPVAGAAGEHVALEADWQLVSPAGTILHQGQARIREPSQTGAASAAEAMSAALGKLADRIAAGLAGR